LRGRPYRWLPRRWRGGGTNRRLRATRGEGGRDRCWRDRRQSGAGPPRMAHRAAGASARETVDGLSLLRRRRTPRRGEPSWRQRDPSVAYVELRRRRAPSQTPARAPWLEADPTALGLDAESGRPSLWARAGDAHVRCLCRTRAHVRGRAQVLVAGVQLQDRQARAGRVRFTAQPASARAPPRAVPAQRAAWQTPLGQPFPRGLARLRIRLLAR